MSATVTAFTQENLVSSRESDGADLLDPAFINAWGLAIRPAGAGGHWWITNTDTSRVTLYVGDSPTVPFGQDGLSVLGVPGAAGNDPVDIVIDPPTRNGTPLAPPSPTPATVMPGSNPTGQVFSGSTTDFLVDGTSLTGTVIADAPARFITVSEDGTIAAWGELGSSPAQRMDAFRVVIDNSAAGAVYKGVTVSAETGSFNLLYAANFSGNAIEVYDAAWQPVATSGFVLADAPGDRDPADFAPFNIERVFDASRGEEVLIVPYARVANAAEGEEESTDGFVVKYDLAGNALAMSDADGLFNAPWGVAVAPDEWGDFDQALLVGNFGDGRILALDIETLAFEGFLLDEAGRPIVIDGLWDIIFGNGASLGATDKLYFAAGPEEETHGLFGSLSIAATSASVGLETTPALAAGNHFSLFLKDGQVFAAGENIVGQLGQGVSGFDIPAAIPLTLPDGFAGEIVSVSAGLVHGTFLTADGELYSWGLGNFGRLGLGDQDNRTTPSKIEGVLADKKVVVATHGNGASYAITDDGALYAWGQNTNGQLGLGDTTNRLVPTEVTALAGETVTDIATGTSHTLALTEDGKVYAWGAARQGQLGSPDALDATGNPLTRVLSPVPVQGLPDNVVNVSASTLTSYAVTADGRVFGWGEGRFGQLLQGTDNSDGTFTPATANVLAPVELTALPDSVVDVKGGARWAVALTADGDVYAWGPNDEGPTGGLDGDPAAESNASFYPTKLAGLDAAFIVEIATGPNHVMARASDGRIFTFGANSDGRLGYPTAGLTTEPEVVPFPDDPAPYLLTARPFEGAGDVARNQSFVLTFTEEVLAGAGTITFANLDDPAKSLSFDVTDADSVAISGAEVTLLAPEFLRANTNYAIRIEAGAFTDATGQGFAGIASADVTTFNFRTGAAITAGSIDKADLIITNEEGGTPPGSEQAGDPLPVAALGLVATTPITANGRDWARAEYEGAWGGLKNLALEGLDPRWGDALLVANFADVRLDLADAGMSDLTVSVVGARRGSVETAAGNDTIDWFFHSPGRSFVETARIDSGAGNDVVRASTVARTTLDQTLLADNALPANGPQWNASYDGRFATLEVELGAGDDRVDATDVRLLARGGDGNDLLNGGSRDDDLSGDAGDDRVNGRAGDNAIDGGDGNDVLLGQAGNDVIFGGTGNDFIDGGEGDDVLAGGAGSDVLIGGAGNDRIAGGAGLDTLFGGTGSDIFVLTPQTADRDWIRDFETGQDMLEMSAALFGGGLSAGALAPARLVVGTAATQAGIGQLLFDSAAGVLRWDADGAGGAPAAIIATLVGTGTLAASDFLIV
jgi:uncharacterized protein (TIGR03118 family)